MILALLACHHAAPPPPPPEPADVPHPREGGAVAGPHYVVEAPPAPALGAEVPGQGVLPAYVSLLRRDLADRMAGCTNGKGGNGALLELSLGPDGAVVGQVLARPSGDPGWDECLTSSVALGPFEAPPPELVERDGYRVALVFR